MKFRDPTRPQLADRPCWLAAPMMALPDIVIEVGEAEQKFDIRLMLANSMSSGHWVETRGLGLVDVARLLVDWHDSPEQAVQQWFKAEPPDMQRFYEKRAKPQVARVLVVAGDVNVEDLGL